jgi:hypothetical protein
MRNEGGMRKKGNQESAGMRNERRGLRETELGCRRE